HLPTIDQPEYDLITKHLTGCNFSEAQIKEIKQYREVVLICDGFDEIRQMRNLYTSNELNEPGQWRVKMIISCRSTYLGKEYKDLFQPLDRNRGFSAARLFQEAVIVPFSKSQIREYVGQYVLMSKDERL